MTFSIVLLAILISTAFAAPAGEWPQLAGLSKGGKFPPGEEERFLSQCQQVATAQGFDSATVNRYCACGAAVLERDFTDAELSQLDSKDGADAKLLQKAQRLVQKSCAPK
ncbi:hypothetical protein PWT90_03141 [Aphanocladium album]|nr:hypothetical protein PWT90_03141 [Aphanocladium album]